MEGKQYKFFILMSIRKLHRPSSEYSHPRQLAAYSVMMWPLFANDINNKVCGIDIQPLFIKLSIISRAVAAYTANTNAYA